MKVLVYLAPEKPFHKIGTMLDLQEFLRRCDSGSVQEAQRQIMAKLPILASCHPIRRTPKSLHPRGVTHKQMKPRCRSVSGVVEGGEPGHRV
jgi:hypothetical protein